MRIADNIPPKVQGAVAVLMLLGLALNLMLAVSPLWGWHPFLGWASSAVLFAFAWDERKSLRAAMRSEALPGDRYIAYFLIGAPAIGLLVNAGVVLFAN